MLEINFIKKNFSNSQELKDSFESNLPVSHLVLDNFLPLETALKLEEECKSIPQQYWKKFTRRDSYMEECLDLQVAPVAFALVNQIHSQLGMNWLSRTTGIDGLIPDPYLIGAGYSRSYNGDTLKTHTDFNWNETVKLHRILTMIIYLSSDWQENYNGALEFKDFNNEYTVKIIPTIFNRCVIWKYHKFGYHGFNKPLDCPTHISRNSFRLFFYTSNSTYHEDDLPHRSLYWFDPIKKEPYDIKT